jgi:hypothetical protein
MFLNFQKISNQTSNVLIKSDSIMLLESANVMINGTLTAVTSVEIAGYTRMGFNTPSTFSQVVSVVRSVDVRAGFDPAVCGANLVYPTMSYPLVQTNMIFNNTMNELVPYAFNPTYLVSAESVSYIDVFDKTQRTALMIVLHDVNPRRIMTNMTFNQLKTILGAIDVPTS